MIPLHKITVMELYEFDDDNVIFKSVFDNTDNHYSPIIDCTKIPVDNLMPGIYVTNDNWNLLIVDENMNMYITVYSTNISLSKIRVFEKEVYRLREIRKMPLKDIVALLHFLPEL